MRRLVRAAAVLLAVLAVPSAAGAAQEIGITSAPDSVALLRYEEGAKPMGMVVEFLGLNGERQHVRVEMPRGRDLGSANGKLRVRYDDPPAGTVERPCLPIAAKAPPGAELVDFKNCGLLLDDEIVTTMVQTFPKHTPDFGGRPGVNGFSIYVSAHALGDDATATVYPNPSAIVDTSDAAPYEVPGTTGLRSDYATAILLAFPRWSKFHTGTLKHSAKKHFPVLFGSLTYGGAGVYGPGDRYGAPINAFGRNVYIDTLDSDYGDGWRRIMGVLTQPTNGTFCYEFSKKGGSAGKTGISRSNTYRLTAIGPGLTPVVQVPFHGPTFPFGNDQYNPLTDKWGTNLSEEQTAALRQQAALMGRDWARPVKGTDCAQTLRQLTTSMSFF